MTVLSNTNVSFLTGVPFDNSYAHTRWFDSKSEQYSYFKSFEKFSRTFNNFQKINGRYYVDLSQNVQDVMDLNYLMFQNAEYSNKWFYCFITNVTSLTSRNTRIYFEVDVIQTWRFDISFKKSFIARQHENTSNNWNVIPEAINIGNEYETVNQITLRPHNFYWLVYCIKERVDLDYDEALEDGNFYTSPDTLSYYVMPIPYPDSVATLNVYYGDSTEYITFSPETVSKIMYNFRHNTAMPGNIVSCYITEYLPIEVVQENTNIFRIRDVAPAVIDASKDLTILRVLDKVDYNYVHDLDGGSVFSLFTENMSKLRYYPYTVIEVSDGRGNVVNFKPEGLQHVNGKLLFRVIGSIAYSNYVAYGLDGYNKNGVSGIAELLNNALISNSPQDIAVLDDRTTAYIQGAKNSLEAQKRTWTTDLHYQRIGHTIRGTASAANMANNIASSAMTKNIGAHSASNGSGMPNIGGIIDDSATIAQSYANYQYAGEDFQNKVNEQNAMLEDIGNQPPALIKQGTNVNASIGNNLFGIRIAIKRVKPEYLRIARNYFHVFGYKSNVFAMPNLRTRTHFNYIQTTMCNVQCKFYNEDIVKIKAIFDSGITLWHTNDMYNYDVENEVI